MKALRNTLKKISHKNVEKFIQEHLSLLKIHVDNNRFILRDISEKTLQKIREVFLWPSQQSKNLVELIIAFPCLP